MKRFLIALGISAFSLVSFSLAENYLNMGDFLTIYFEGISQNIPESWKYIDVKFSNVEKNTALYQSLQKGIYLDFFPNLKQELAKDKIIKQENMAKLLQFKIDKDFEYEKGENVTVAWTKYMIDFTNELEYTNDNLDEVQMIFDDVISRIGQDYIFESGFNLEGLGYGAIKGYVDALNDPYSVFMEPSEAQSFEEEIEGSFEGIGAQIESKDGMFVIVAPLKNSPAEKYGLKAGDIIVGVNDKVLEVGISLLDVTKLVKGPANTFVKITIKRGNETKILNIKREKIVLNSVEYELLDRNNCYISISQFNYQAALQFDSAINFFDNKKCGKYILDVRNNPGGELDVVSYILNYFVADGKSITSIKYKDKEEKIIADDSVKKLDKEKVIVLINQGSASASEIFAGTIKEYVKNSLLLGSKSYGKGSVQSLVEYIDGSMLKYTVAKRLTGLFGKSIDKVGIQPDMVLEDDPNTEIDEVLEMAKKL